MRHSQKAGAETKCFFYIFHLHFFRISYCHNCSIIFCVIQLISCTRFWYSWNETFYLIKFKHFSASKMSDFWISIARPISKWGILFWPNNKNKNVQICWVNFFYFFSSSLIFCGKGRKHSIFYVLYVKQ